MLYRVLNRGLFFGFCLMASNLLSLNAADADQAPRFKLSFGASKFSGYPNPNRDVADKALAILMALTEEYGEVLNIPADTNVSLRLLSPEEFKKYTGAPAWTSAMYYKGEISVPIFKQEAVNFKELERALRHEFVHAITGAATKHRLSAMFDEGLAQKLEGAPNPILCPELRKWLKESEPLPLSWLEAGFPTLSRELVPVAYAQSLVAVNLLLSAHSYNDVNRYFSLLRENYSDKIAFQIAFGISMEGFEAEVNRSLKEWAAEPKGPGCQLPQN